MGGLYWQVHFLPKWKEIYQFLISFLCRSEYKTEIFILFLILLKFLNLRSNVKDATKTLKAVQK